MHIRFLLHITTAAALLFSACSTDLEVPFPRHDPKLTLNTFLTEGKPIDLYLTRSFGTLEDVTADKILIRDAVVQLFRDGTLLGNMAFIDTMLMDTVFSYTFSPGPGLPDTTFYYIEERKTAKYLPAQPIDLPRAGETYRFVATHPSYGTATAETTIPAQPDVLSLRVARDSLVTREFIDGYQDRWASLKVRINDPAGEENYYNFIASFRYRYPIIDFPEADTTFGWDWAATEIRRDPDGYSYGVRGPLADTEIDGTGALYAWLRLPGCCGYANERDDKNYEYIDLTLQVISMTDIYAQFQKKLQLQRENRLDGIESAFLPTEPVVIPSNVEGGYGVVGAFNSTTVRIGL